MTDLNDIPKAGTYTLSSVEPVDFESTGRTLTSIPAPSKDHIHDYLEWVEDTTAVQILEMVSSWYRTCYICGVKKTVISETFEKKEVKHV